MKILKTVLFFVFWTAISSCKQENQVNLNVLQFNIWQEGTVVENGFDAIIDEIIHTNADLIALSEVRNYNNTSLDQRLVEALKERGYVFYAERSRDSGILSKYPILEQTALFPVVNDHGSITKALIDIHGTEVAFYSGHLDYLNCALYLPRGYDGSTWKKMDGPITDISILEDVNLASQRDDAINVFIEDAKKEIAKGRIVIYGGDNNEPSHLDWIKENSELYDHNGVVMAWNNTVKLEQADFLDAYRIKYPNPITHPGFTYPANNELVPINKLAWSPDADDRDRIDFIFYHPDSRLVLKDAKIVGPKGDIIRNKRAFEKTEDVIMEPQGIWPTDHKAVLASFVLKY